MKFFRESTFQSFQKEIFRKLRQFRGKRTEQHHIEGFRITQFIRRHIRRSDNDTIGFKHLTGDFKLSKLFKVMIYIAPILLLVILVFAIFEAFGINFGGFLKF